MNTKDITTVAIRSGVSTDTVSKVLSDSRRVNPSLVDRVLQAVAELEYLRDSSVKSSVKSRKVDRHARVIGVILADSSNVYQGAIAAAAREEGARQGFATIIANGRGGRARQLRNIEMFVQQHVFGLIVVSSSGIDSIPETGFAGTAVFVESHGFSLAYNSVSADNVAGGRLAAAHLLETGRRRIAFISSAFVPQSAQRLYGARAELDSAHGMSLEVIAAESNSSAAGLAIGNAIAQRDPDQIPDAIICANDPLALGLLQSAKLKDAVRIPQDLALIGFDDSPFTASTRPALSSIKLPADEIGKAAVNLLTHNSPRRQHLRFEPTLIERASTRIPAGTLSLPTP
ncbi:MULTISPECIES: LacI family DNA-binding transcriptional regulator [unclassified Arthrobacter]|uniref:LacI family DNA-binding transcriptional regulator n=1 Tax=unclassified Arthrobacter TaxID=235627 RepID=UPI0014924E4E|nr:MULTISPECIES: LacI family DNA-binding transcriptional regulator [unclassified Arthrobacter]MBE0010121.1 LacI family transcriptional regulator [Arthrobacter sp. AET 35A]NOJ64095.1 LacI family DNA-binding transcriptional regulator [Arthrobacter sp. 147(2020)]